MQIRAQVTKWLALLVLTTTLPLFAFLVYSTYAIGQARLAEVEAELQQQADNLASEVSNRIEGIYGYVNNLSMSNAAVDKDVPALYRFARRMQESNRNIRAVSLIDPKQEMVFLSLRPLGERFAVAETELVKQVFDTRAPNLSGPFKSPLNNNQVVALSVPVMVDGDVAYCLRGILSAESFKELIDKVKVRPGWIATVVDSGVTIVSRSQDSDKYVGKKGSTTLQEAIQTRNWAVRNGVTVEGVAAKSVLRPVGRWGWYVTVAVPTAMLTADVKDEILRLSLLGLLVVTLSAVSVFWVSRRIERAIRNAAVSGVKTS